MTWLRSMGSPSSKRADTLQPMRPHWIRFNQGETFVRAAAGLCKALRLGPLAEAVEAGTAVPRQIDATKGLIDETGYFPKREVARLRCLRILGTKHVLVSSSQCNSSLRDSEAFLQHCNAAGYHVSEQMEQAGWCLNDFAWCIFVKCFGLQPFFQAMGEAEMPGRLRWNSVVHFTQHRSMASLWQIST